MFRRGKQEVVHIYRLDGVHYRIVSQREGLPDTHLIAVPNYKLDPPLEKGGPPVYNPLGEGVRFVALSMLGEEVRGAYYAVARQLGEAKARDVQEMFIRKVCYNNRLDLTVQKHLY